MNDWLAEAIEDLDVEDLTIAVLGSHSALEVARGAQAQGFRSLVVAQQGRHRTYAEHFKAEEEPDTGLYAIVGEAGPQHNRAIDALFAEHRDLESAVAELQTLLGERADHPLGPLGNKVKDFVSQLRQHEANETELLSVAANDDMGAAEKKPPFFGPPR